MLFFVVIVPVNITKDYNRCTVHDERKARSEETKGYIL